MTDPADELCSYGCGRTFVECSTCALQEGEDQLNLWIDTLFPTEEDRIEFFLRLDELPVPNLTPLNIMDGYTLKKQVGGRNAGG